MACSLVLACVDAHESASAIDPETTSSEPAGSEPEPESSDDVSSSGDEPGGSSTSPEETGSTGEPELPEPGRMPPGTWIAVAPGSYTMGAAPTDPCPMSSDNDIAHDVTLTHAFEISATEITNAEYEVAVGSPRPWAEGCDDCPVTMVTWHDAAAICNAYSDYAGLPHCYACDDAGTCTASAQPCAGYRLPTEAEWEYAARAGETTGVHGGQIEICSSADPLLDTLGWYLYNSDGGTHPVAQLQPNAWGLYDTIGNAWEWAHDGYVTDASTLPAIDPVGESTDDLRSIRGGSYNCTPGEVRLAHRSALPSPTAGLNVGLRCVRTLPD